MTVKLSKSRFVAGCQCLKRLYLQAHEPELAAEPDAAAEAIIEQGREVGLLARQLFPGGVEVRSDDLDQAIRATRELVASPEVSAIFEGTFEHGGVLVRVAGELLFRPYFLRISPPAAILRRAIW